MNDSLPSQSLFVDPSSGRAPMRLEGIRSRAEGRRQGQSLAATLQTPPTRRPDGGREAFRTASFSPPGRLDLDEVPVGKTSSSFVGPTGRMGDSVSERTPRPSGPRPFLRKGR